MEQTNENIYNKKHLSCVLLRKKIQNILYQRNVFYFKSKLKIQY